MTPPTSRGSSWILAGFSSEGLGDVVRPRFGTIVGISDGVGDGSAEGEGVGEMEGEGVGDGTDEGDGEGSSPGSFARTGTAPTGSRATATIAKQVSRNPIARRGIDPPSLDVLRTTYGEGEGFAGYEDRSLVYQRLLRELIEAQRSVIVRLRNEGAISNDVMHRIERDLDLEETRLGS